ncbi:MAG: DNA polymerase Y family protein [Deltaproteobacteria bacterium]|nr:DNA polymerase Y family protein [Deltaproteobacteria bacterium]
MPARRIAAIVLPRLLCEIAGSGSSRRPVGVVLSASEHLSDQATLDAVDQRARKAGLRAGLTIAEARAYVAALDVRRVTEAQVHQALASVAEVAMAFGPTVSLCAPDAVYVDLTGAAHLAGGEEALAAELHDRVAQLDHAARVVIADGPQVGAAVARHATTLAQVIPPGQGHKAMAALPCTALPLDDETTGWLVRVGVVTVSDLGRLPRDQVASRLGDRAPLVLSLIAGHDPSPLVAYEPPRVVSEELSWEEGVEQQSALVFVLNRLTARVAARLEGRGEATRALVLQIQCDKGIAHLRGVAPQCTLRVDLPSPLSRADDLLRAMRAKLEGAQLGAPALAMTLQAPLVTRAPRVQLDLSRDVQASPDALPVLLAELSAEIGADRVGVLALQPSYRPESRSQLRPIGDLAHLRRSSPNPTLSGPGAAVTRILASPHPIGQGPIAIGDLVVCMPVALEVKAMEFDVRLHGVDWWTSSPVSRDYARVWLSNDSGSTGWVFIDRTTGESWLHGWIE